MKFPSSPEELTQAVLSVQTDCVFKEVVGIDSSTVYVEQVYEWLIVNSEWLKPFIQIIPFENQKGMWVAKVTVCNVHGIWLEKDEYETLLAVYGK